jgi:hypothetical protein
VDLTRVGSLGDPDWTLTAALAELRHRVTSFGSGSASSGVPSVEVCTPNLVLAKSSVIRAAFDSPNSSAVRGPWVLTSAPIIVAT